LSGGQAKKIAIIQAIVNKADIYILDETFTGLDKESLMNVQFILKSMIENATFLIVDHHAQDNNYNNFYDSEVHFTNGSAFEREIFSITEEFTPYFPSDSIQSFKEEVCLPILGLV
jgi:ABC-type Mn2+/Zn2+ transport system ATPase subunit